MGSLRSSVGSNDVTSTLNSRGVVSLFVVSSLCDPRSIRCIAEATLGGKQY
jgi:hypothetical protein